jgi:periplasmic divalent cation tolerance protein
MTSKSKPGQATPQHCMVYVTAASRDEALKIGRALVNEKLAACANVLGQVDSIYRWQGKVEEAQEVVVIAKTRRALADKAVARVKALHSYDVPCAVVYDMAAGLPDYLAWIDREMA